MRPSRHQLGFTLVELLISLALLGILLTAVVTINIGTSRSAAALQARNDMLPELQITQNYMAGKLREAAYVFPVGSNIQLTATGTTTRNAATGNYNWQVGTHPIIAFILPPRVVVPGGCATATASTIADYCYAFYAFYALNRGDYVAAVTGADDPGDNSANDATAMVLMEYRGYYSSASLNTNVGYLPNTTAIPTGNRGRMLMDYLSPYPSTSALPLFSQATTSQQAGVTTVTLNLAALQSVAGQSVRIPSSDGSTFNSLTVYPRNVGKPSVSN